MSNNITIHIQKYNTNRITKNNLITNVKQLLENGDNEIRNYITNVVRNNKRSFLDTYTIGKSKKKYSVLEHEKEKLKYRKELSFFDIQKTHYEGKSLIDLKKIHEKVFKGYNNLENKIKQYNNLKLEILKIIEQVEKLNDTIFVGITGFYEIYGILKYNNVTYLSKNQTRQISSKLKGTAIISQLLNYIKDTSKNKMNKVIRISKFINHGYWKELLENLNSQTNNNINKKFIILIKYILLTIEKLYDKTQSNLVIAILGNKKLDDFSKKRVGRFNKTIKTNNSTPVSRYNETNNNTIIFNEDQTKTFISLMIADIIHDSGNMSIDEVRELKNNIYGYFGFGNVNDTNSIIQKLKNYRGKQTRTSNTFLKSQVDQQAKTIIKSENILKQYYNVNEFLYLKFPHSMRNMSGKNFIRYRVGDNKYYKKFNILINSNTKNVKSLYNFITKLQYGKNKNIAHKIICPAQLVNKGVHISPMRPSEQLTKQLQGMINSKNIHKFNDTPTNLNLIFKTHKTNYVKVNIEYNYILKKFVLKINDEELNIVTAQNSSNGNYKNKIGKFFGDFIQILKCVSEQRKYKRPIAFGTVDSMAARIYLFMSKVVGVKARLFYMVKTDIKNLNETGMELKGQYINMYIYGMGDILSDRCSILKNRKLRHDEKSRTKNINETNRNNNKNIVMSKNSNSNTNINNTHSINSNNSSIMSTNNNNPDNRRRNT